MAHGNCPQGTPTCTTKHFVFWMAASGIREDIMREQVLTGVDCDELLVVFGNLCLWQESMRMNDGTGLDWTR